MDMDNANSRRVREQKTVEAMIRIYCREQHRTAEGLCEPCGDLLQYAAKRLERCPYGVDKPTCAKCPIHCYQPAMRRNIRVVMSYAGRRMLYRHPVLAVLHLMDGWRRRPSGSRRERHGGQQR
jgi:hypothetical protein